MPTNDRFRQVIAPLLVIFAVATGGCGGGGGEPAADTGGDGVAPVTTVTLGGTIEAPAGIVIDSDVNDYNEPLPVTRNNSLRTPQSIPNPVSLGGYVNVRYSGAPGQLFADGDTDDYFSVALNTGDRILLSIAERADLTPLNHLNLYIYDTDGTELNAVEDTGAVKTLLSPGSGTYIVRVWAASGASNYILTVGSNNLDTPQDTLFMGHDFMPGQAIVRFAGDTRPSAAGQSPGARAAALGMHMAAGARGRSLLLTFDQDPPDGVFKILGIEHSRKRGGASEDAFQRKRDTLKVIEALRRRGDVLSADPNYILHHFATPDDTYYRLQWHYPLINLPRAWDITLNAANEVVVAVIDSGVLLGHPELAGQLTEDGYDFISNISMSNDGDGIDPNPDDPGDGSTPGASSFHGTHVAGTIAALTDNGSGMAGIAWGTNIKVMPIRVLGIDGGTLYDIEQALLYAAGLPNDSGRLPAQRADIINLSLGGGASAASTQAVLDRVRDAGVIVIAAAGNEPTGTPSYPASYSGVISVSAVNINSTRASYSNYGMNIDVAAPGGDDGDLDGDGYPDYVWSTCGDDSSGVIDYNYAAIAGTSMATPHVSGVVALMKALRPAGLTPEELDVYLRSGDLTHDIGEPDRDDFYGYGLIDAVKAALTAQNDAEVSALTVFPSVLNFGTALTEADLTVTEIGTQNLSVAEVVEDIAWLTVEPAAIDADGIGIYTVRVDRGVLTPGTYNGSIRFRPSSGDPLAVTVTLQVGTAPAGPADAGFHYVLLVNADTDEVVQQADVAAVDGAYSYSFTGVPTGGRYLIYAGSDRDNDNLIDDAGESLGAYLSLDQITIVTADGDRPNLDFVTNLKPFLPTSSRSDNRSEDAPSFRRIR